MKLERHRDAEARTRSVFVFVKALLQLDGLHEDHRKGLLHSALWMATEAEWPNKYETRFRSEGARSGAQELRHDHVLQRAKMVKDLIEAGPDNFDLILKKAVGCVVTKDEHKRLNKIGKQVDGWPRYQLAGITVIDVETGEKINLDAGPS